MRKELDEALLAFRVARKAVGGTESWLRAVRQAVGVPVDEVAERLGVSERDVFRMERAERDSRIVLGTLRRAADALGCELVYALTPRQGTLEDLAAVQKEKREEAREKAREEEKERVEKIEKQIGWRAAMQKSIRRELRKRGIRVR
jgi:transcriptional regulator with XRE-family HTH domain